MFISKITNFFKLGGFMGQTVQILAKIYMSLENEKLSELERLLKPITFRYLSHLGKRSQKSFNQTDAADAFMSKSLLFLKEHVNQSNDIGLIAICYAVIASENDVEGIENDVVQTIIKNLNHLGIPEDIQFGRKYSSSDFMKTLYKSDLKKYIS